MCKDHFASRETTNMCTLKLCILIAFLSVTLGQNREYYYQQPITSHRPPYKELDKIFEWRNLVFGFPNDVERTRALESGRYKPESPIPIDIDVYYPSNGGPARHFVTAPRFGQGVPYSLAYVSPVQQENGSVLQAYPSYDWHSSHGADCDGLTSVYRVHIDSCGQMWILDSGEIQFVQHCAPQVVVIDLATNQLIHRYRLPENVYKAKISRFVTILADIKDPWPQGQCTQALVYLCDPTGMGIVVYDVLGNSSWRVENKFTYPDPRFGTHTVMGESFELLDGAFTVAVTPSGLGLQRHLIFHALSNEVEIAIPLDVLNNATNWQSGISSSLKEFKVLGRRGVQCGAMAISQEGIWFCGFLEPIAIYGWNIRTPYTNSNLKLLAHNPQTLQFISGMKIIRRPSDGAEELWVLSNRLQKAFTGALNYSEINYRVQRCDVDDMLQGRALPLRVYLLRVSLNASSERLGRRLSAFLSIPMARIQAICICIVISILFAAEAQELQLKQLRTLHKWTNLSNFLPVDVDMEYGDEGRHRTFLTIPRLNAGTPFTLATVAASDNEVIENPRLVAYPNMAWHLPPNNCSGIISAMRTYIDECWRLWVVDSGQINSLQLCPPQILTFDLIKDELVQRHALPPHNYVPGISIFTSLTVDLSDGQCLGGRAYVADAWGYGLIVYDSLTGKSWRIEDKSMQPSSLEALPRQAGIFTVSLSPSEQEDRFLYFHTLNGFNELAIPLSLVNNASYWSASNSSKNRDIRSLGTRGTQCESEVMDSDGNLYCSLISLGALIKWQEHSQYTPDDLRVVAYNPHQLKFITGLKINRNSRGENELWALSSEPKLFVGGIVRENDIKFQIVGCRTADLLANTPCTVGAGTEDQTKTL
ncbi:uncharacterized protein [Drosophila tropicalis]|uniref:uncharacterized protein n=1 Tax=Drosophila tropicalis TaxID=46794 RepID=UPI0035AB853C